jgi:hypothetical protein
MVAESRADVHHSAPRCLLGLFDAMIAGLAEWSEFDEEAERLSIEVCGLSRQGLTALIESSTHEIPTTEHRSLHQEEGDFVPWADVGAGGPWPSTAGLTSRCSPASDGLHPIRSPYPAPCWEFKGAGSLRPAPRV